MLEKPFIPPTRKPVSEFPTPSHAVAFYTELVNRDDPAYIANAPVKRGSRYSTMVGAKRDVMATYPDLFFLQEQKYQLNDQLVLWHWATDENAHDTYNADVTYVANAITYPAFTRVYTTRRELYEAEPTLPIGSPLPGIIAVEITSPGQNHTVATGVIDGTSVLIDFVVDSGGSLVSAVITNTGDELIQNGTSITIIGDGQDSSAIAVTQPVGCVLTAQKKEELPQDDPTQHELVRVTRTYETLPGPWIYSVRIDKDGMLVTLKTRRQVSDFITDKDEILGGDWVQTWHKGTDNFVAEENIESRPLPGNPILDTRIEEDGMVTSITKTLIDVSLGVSNETLVAGVWTKRRIEEIASTTFVKDTQASDKVAWQMVEYRPIPGNDLVSTRVEEDGKITTITKTLSDTSTLVSSEVISGGNWIRTHKEEVSDLVAYKVVESRPIPGNPLVTTRIEEDGIPTSITKILKDTSTIVSSEVISSGNWIKTFKEEVSDLVANEVTESRAIPGNPLVDTKVEEDGMTLTTTKILSRASSIVTSEVISSGNWIRTFKEEVSDLVAYQVQQVRPVPGNPIVKDTIEKDGKTLAVVRTLKDFTTITPSEQILAGNWVKVEAEPVSDLVAWELVTARNVPGNAILSYEVNAQDEIVFKQTILKARASITPSASEGGGNITTVEAEEVSDLVANEVTKLFTFLDEGFYQVSIENLIPREFMAFIPTHTESHILSGTASMPTLGLGEFEHSQKQLTKLLYEDRITSLGSISLPITHTNQELTEEYGGGVLNINLTLDTLGSQAIDQGLLIVSSTLTDLGNGMVIKRTAQLNGAAWPSLIGTHIDERYLIEIGIIKQVLGAGTTGGVDGDGTIREVRSLDQWRSIQIASKLNVATLPTDTITYAGMTYSFPPELTDQIIDWASAVCGCSSTFSAILVANMDQYSGPVKTRITEQFYNGPPPDDVVITQFFPEAHNFGYAWSSYCGDGDPNCVTKSGAPNFHIPLCLHGDIRLCIGNGPTCDVYSALWTFSATNPSALPHGSYIMLPPHVERWRFGVFRRVLTEVQVPA